MPDVPATATAQPTNEGQQEEIGQTPVYSVKKSKGELLVVGQVVFGHDVHEESPMHREFVVRHELHDDTDPNKSAPLEQERFCQIQCVRDTPQTGTLMQEELKRPSPNWYTYTCSWFQMQINNIACGPQQPEKTTPKTRHYPTRDRAELPEPHQ